MSHTFNWNFKVETRDYEVGVDTAECYGYFEHCTLGDGRAGGLWFSIIGTSAITGRPVLELLDYDGVAVLPLKVVDILRKGGFIVDEIFE